MGTLYELAEDLMDSVRQQALQSDIALPARQIIYMTPIPPDCEQVAVMFNGWTLYPETGQIQTCMTSQWMAGFSVIITRCTPAVSKNPKNPIPGSELMGAAALIASTDAELFRDIVGAMSGFMSVTIAVQAPSGGLQTVELDISIPGI